MVEVSFLYGEPSFEGGRLDDFYEHENTLNSYDSFIMPFMESWFDETQEVNVSTSGSTGTPKKIAIAKSAMKASAQLTLEYFKLSKQDTFLLCLPTQFIAGKLMWIRSMEANAKILVAKPTSNPLKDLTESIDFAAMTPHQVHTVLEETPDKMALIKIVIIGGAPVSMNLSQRLRAISSACYETYGMTETITHVALKRLNGTNPDAFFESLPNVSFLQGIEGNLIIQAPHVSKEFITTNDLVDLKDPDHFEWLGRKDYVINSGGVKLFPELIERKISHFFSERFFIHKVGDAVFAEIPVLFIEGRDGISLDLLGNVLEKYEVPKKIINLPQFIETPSGKIDRIGTATLLSGH